MWVREEWVRNIVYLYSSVIVQWIAWRKDFNRAELKSLQRVTSTGTLRALRWCPQRLWALNFTSSFSPTMLNILLYIVAQLWESRRMVDTTVFWSYPSNCLYYKKSLIKSFTPKIPTSKTWKNDEVIVSVKNTVSSSSLTDPKRAVESERVYLADRFVNLR